MLDVAAWQVTALAQRAAGDTAGAEVTLARLLEIDPLNHVARFERALALGTDAARQAFVTGIRNEMPHETFLEMATWYHGAGRSRMPRRCWRSRRATPEVLYWRAWLSSLRGGAESASLLAAAHAAPPALAFPFRRESADVFAWAIRQGAEWQPRYYLALIDLGRGNHDAARDRLVALGDGPSFAPFYALRASLLDDHVRAAADLGRAMTLDPGQWRFAKQLADLHIAGGRYHDAVTVARDAFTRAPERYVLGMLTARALVLDGQPGEALAVLDHLSVLPYEGANDGRRLFREAHLLLAVGSLRADPRRALEHVTAGQGWPEHLGAGKPYDDDIDTRVDAWVAARIHARAGAAGEAGSARDRVLRSPHGAAGPGGLVLALALRDAGRVDESRRAIDAWAATTTRPELAVWGRGVGDGTPGALPLPRHDAGDYAIIDADVARGNTDVTCTSYGCHDDPVEYTGRHDGLPARSQPPARHESHPQPGARDERAVRARHRRAPSGRWSATERQAAYLVILRDQQIDELEQQLDRLCLEFLVRQQPAAGHLRFAYAAIKISTELERIGDHAEAMARRVLKLEQVRPAFAYEAFREMGEASLGMLRDAVRAFVEGDAELAQRDDARRAHDGQDAPQDRRHAGRRSSERTSWRSSPSRCCRRSAGASSASPTRSATSVPRRSTCAPATS